MLQETHDVSDQIPAFPRPAKQAFQAGEWVESGRQSSDRREIRSARSSAARSAKEKNRPRTISIDTRPNDATHRDRPAGIPTRANRKELVAAGRMVWQRPREDSCTGCRNSRPIHHAIRDPSRNHGRDARRQAPNELPRVASMIPATRDHTVLQSAHGNPHRDGSHRRDHIGVLW